MTHLNKLKILVVSDLHFNHKNIIKYCSRPYCNEFEMNKDLIRRYNSVVKPNDIVWNLGDIGWNNGESLKYLFGKLNGHKELLVLGNHDKGSEEKYKAMGFERVYRDCFAVDYQVDENTTIKILLSHKPAVSESMIDSLDMRFNSYLVLEDDEYEKYDLNIHGHIHNSDREEINDGKHYNVSIEVINYQPKPLEDIVWEFLYEQFR